MLCGRHVPPSALQVHTFVNPIFACLEFQILCGRHVASRASASQVHTLAHPMGESRAQVRPVPMLSASLLPYYQPWPLSPAVSCERCFSQTHLLILVAVCIKLLGINALYRICLCVLGRVDSNRACHAAQSITLTRLCHAAGHVCNTTRMWSGI